MATGVISSLLPTLAENSTPSKVMKSFTFARKSNVILGGVQADPFAQQQQLQQGSAEPKKDDPWAKKDLFNLDQLNLADKGMFFFYI